MPDKLPMYAPPTLLALAPDGSNQQSTSLNFHIFHKHPLLLLPLLIVSTLYITLHFLHPHNLPSRPLHQPQRRLNNPLNPILSIRNQTLKRHRRVPEALRQRVDIIRLLVAFRLGGRGIRGQGFVVRDLGIEAEEEVVVLEG